MLTAVSTDSNDWTWCDRGTIDTPMIAEVRARGLKLPAKSMGMLGRIGRPEESAKLMCFLLGDESSFITGSVYTIDGGWYC